MIGARGIIKRSILKWHRRRLREKGYAQHVLECIVFDERLPEWEATVKEIESGYSRTREDYCQAIISCRNGIEIMRQYWPDEYREEIRNRLRQADKRLMAATVPVREPIWGDEVTLRIGLFWRFRAPESCLNEFGLTRI